MIEVKVNGDAKPKKGSEGGLFEDAVVVRYRPPGSKSWQVRGAGEDPASVRKMLERLVDEIMRRAFPDADEGE